MTEREFSLAAYRQHNDRLAAKYASSHEQTATYLRAARRHLARAHGRFALASVRSAVWWLADAMDVRS